MHLEIKPDGRMVIIGFDRGVETLREEIESVDELMYSIFKDMANAAAFAPMPGVKYDYEARQKIALDKIGKISDEWRERLRQEQLSYKNES